MRIRGWHIAALGALGLLLSACEDGKEEYEPVPVVIPDTPDDPEPSGPTLVTIPDAEFKSWLVSRFDGDGDGEISVDEAKNVTEIDVSTHAISSLEGIRSFPNLVTLSAVGSRAADRTILGRLTELDLSGLSKLQSVTVRHNYITALTLSGNNALTTLICYGNSLTALDLSGAPQLDHVDAGDCAIESVNTGGNAMLRILAIHNNRLSALDLSRNKRLESLTCDRNRIPALDLSACPSLSYLDCSPMGEETNLLTSLTLSEGMSIEGITVNRSSSSIPDGTEIIWVEGPDPETLGTGLRTLYIKTPGQAAIDSKDDWLENCSLKLVDDDGNVYYDNAAVAVKGRGNSTWWAPKRPYTFKLPEKADLIGTGADKRWVLLANWLDRTLLRNEVAFEMGRRSGLEWTPSGEFVELFLNGVHQGNYWMGEKIKNGKARLTSDFLFEMDTYYDATWRFYSQYGWKPNTNDSGLPIGVKEPDDDQMTQEKLDELQALVAGVEEAIYLGNGDYREKIDLTSFIDWYLIHELTYNGEPNHPKSCYFYFRDGVMYAGPLWDFDWYTYQQGKTRFFLPDAIYFKELFKDAIFVSALKARWAELKPKYDDIGEYVDAKAAEIRASEKINWAMWPCTSSNVNGDENLSFNQAVARLRSALLARITVIDNLVKKL